ncbi:MAG: hypothetical protein NTX64_14140, partial [Elusimicrobia bacterium]|nr:hypothetical protein [Elusimicrobiota bacterium]
VWTNVGAGAYQVVDVSSGARIACVGGNFYTENVSLVPKPANALAGAYGPDSPHSIKVAQCTGGVGSIVCTGCGALTTGPTSYTLAEFPSPAISTFTNLTATSFQVNWGHGVVPNPDPPVDGLLEYFLIVSSPGGPLPTPGGAKDTGILALSYSLASLTPNTAYHAYVFAENGDGFFSSPPPYTDLGTVVTKAMAPVSPTYVAGSVLSPPIQFTWGGGGNSPATPYQIAYYTPCTNLTPQYVKRFSDNYTATSISVASNLIPLGNTVMFSVKAQNSAAVPTAEVFVKDSGSLSCETAGGGSSYVALVSPDTGLSNSFVIPDKGTPSNPRQVSVTINAGTFAQATAFSLGAAQLAAPLTGGEISQNAAFTATSLPSLQPQLPMTFAFEVLQAELPSNPSLLSLARLDGSGNPVPLPTTSVPTPAGGYILTAQTNHLSTFAVIVSSPASTLAGRVVYPNPLHIGQGFMTFKNLPAGTRVRVFTLRGEQLFDQHANASGLVEWPATNGAGHQVASGVYLAVLEAGTAKEIMKLVVIR